jgi:hypothetical protein
MEGAEPSMITIIDLSWRAFRPVEVSPNPKIGELYDLARWRSPDLFVFYAPALGEPALILPERLIRAVEELKLSPDRSVAETDLMALLRQDQMTALWSEPADLVARSAAKREVDAVIVVDDEAFPVGLFIPTVVAERLSHTSIVQGSSSNLRQTVEELIEEGEVAEAIAAIADEHGEIHRDHFSELLNYAPPNPYFCEGEGKPHTQSRCPCRRHPGAACGRRTVGSG